MSNSLKGGGMPNQKERACVLSTMANSTSVAERYLSVPEGARFMGISAWTLRELARKGEIKRIKIGRRVLFDRRDLIDFLESRKERQDLGSYRKGPER